VSIEGTNEQMKHRDIAVILATGGMGLVRAAYSAGKPAYGVGPGNAPAYIERTANVKKAVRDIITGKTFDNGVLCSSENSVVCDQAIADEVKREFEAQGGYFMNAAEMGALARVLVTPQRLPNPALVGKTAGVIAEKCGIRVPPATRVLIAPLEGVGRDYPLSIEKLCPVLSFYLVADWREGCERCKQILRYGGMGHTMAIHSQNDQVILEFGLKKPAFRICVNTPTTLGSIGLTTGLDPAMTLGCGGYGGNITSDNISPRHLLNIKRLAYEITPAVGRSERDAEGRETVGRLPRSAAPLRIVASGIQAKGLSSKIDEFLGSRGYRGAPPAPSAPSAPSAPEVHGSLRAGTSSEPAPMAQSASVAASSASPSDLPASPPLEFVCEDDVRQAIQAGRKLVIAERAIVTPSARDLAEKHRVLTFASYRK
jgi:acetaldehyde dehydrogenase (acetylating)